MMRREFIQLAAATPLLFSMNPARSSRAPGDQWRSFELTYTVDLAAQKNNGQLWLPLPEDAGDYQRVISVAWGAAPEHAAMTWDADYRAPMFAAKLAPTDTARQLVVTTTVATRNRNRAPASRHALTPEIARYLEPTANMPVDGIVATTSAQIVRGITDPDARAQAIYNWVVDNTFRKPTVRGCGLGNIKFMLETGDLGGKCADINSLFVGLARAAGLPAREMYGVRVAESAQFASLGRAGDISKAHHCRAEYHSPRHGWVAVDPADVRKVVLEEKLPLNDPRVVALRERLFGYWEMNWVGLNTARDFDLAPPAREPLPYLMYPYAEFGDTRLDGREPDQFDFKLTSRELTHRG